MWTAVVSIDPDFDYVNVVASLNVSFRLWLAAAAVPKEVQQVASSLAGNKSIAAAGAAAVGGGGDARRRRCYSDRIQKTLS